MKAPSDRVRSWLRPLTLPASRIYAAAIASRNRRFDRGDGVHRIDRPVISVGNITTGGTGKSPMVAWIARMLMSHGHQPLIAMRGYKAQPGQLSDEQAEYHALLPSVPVCAQPDRIAALRRYLPDHPEVDCVILDDGFQHRQIRRDLDLVLIDSTRDVFNDNLLPAGNLREPFDVLARADAVIVTRAMHVESAMAQEVERWHGRTPLAWSQHAWRSLARHLPSHREMHTINWLGGKKVVTLLGVGNPKAIIAQVEHAGARIIANVPAGDHERFDRAKLLTAMGLCDGSDGLLVTLKDWVKIEPIVKSLGIDWRTPIIVPELEIEFIAGEAALSQLIVDAIKPGQSAQHDGPDRRVPHVR